MSEHAALEKLRVEIDELDAQILRLLARRMDKARAIGQYKHEHGLAPLDQKRWETVRAALRLHTENLDLPEEFVNQLYELVHEYTLKLEAEIADNA